MSDAFFGRRIPKLRYLALAALSLVLIWFLAQRPSNDRDWQANFAVLPYAVFEDSLVHIHNIRNTTYTTADDYEPAYYDKTLDLRQLETVWFVVSPFSPGGGTAHTFVSFGFSGPEYVSISVEARRERGETYGIGRGLLRQFEMTYVVADERDAIGLRANHYADDVFLYPIAAPRERMQQLFVAMMQRANALREKPRFYNTLLANCTNTIVKHVNTLVPKRIPFSYKVLLPGYSDELAYDLGLIDTNLPFERARARFRVTEQVRRFADSTDFSSRVRAPLRGDP